MKFSNLNRTVLVVGWCLAVGIPALPVYAGIGPVNPGSITFFLADPDLGVVGSYTEGAETIYFETQPSPTKGAARSLNVRLLDAGGRTISATGPSIDMEKWLGNRFDAAAAATSQKLAQPLAAALSRGQADPAFELSDPAFDADRDALTELARDTAAADLSQTAAIVPVSKSMQVKADASGSLYARVSSDFYARVSSELRLDQRMNGGDFEADFRETRLASLELSFPTEENEEGGIGRIETYARLGSSDGQTLAAVFGGDLYPAGWEAIPDYVTVERDMISHAKKMGEATMAAHLLSRTTEATRQLSTAEIAAFNSMSERLRGELLPHTDDSKLNPGPGRPRASPDAGGTWSEYYNLSTNFLDYTHPVAVIGDHSATYVEGYEWPAWNSYWMYAYQAFCNHGDCPWYSGMTHRYTRGGNYHHVFAWAPAYTSNPGLHSCVTGYSLLSFWGHNCNDDAWTQQMWSNFKSSEAGVDKNKCHDPWPDNNTPSADAAGPPQ